jgi:AAA+ superfamily predicted ATPase
VALESEKLKEINVENWFQDSEFVASSDIIFITSETLSGISERIVGLPYVSAICIDRPNQLERKIFAQRLMETEGFQGATNSESVAFYSAGLSLLSIKQIFKRAAFINEPVTPALLFDKTKEIIEKELEGYIEFPRIDHGFESIIGSESLLAKLEELKQCLLSGNPDLTPVGILVPGANGVGKTYIYKAFAKECQWVAVVLKNIRGQYVGQTEKNWERIRSVLEAMSSVMVMYDEADTEIGGRGEQTHDVDRRLFGRILSMMSSQHNRGKIVWIIITARPDRLEPDIKRAGRAGEHLPVFAEEGEGREKFLHHILDRAGVTTDEFSESRMKEFVELTKDYYPSDFDQLLTELRRRRFLEGGLSPESVIEEISDYIPPDVARQREFQELLAVMECTSRELLPEKYKDLGREQIEARLNEIRLQIGDI